MSTREMVYLWTYPKKPNLLSRLIRRRIKATYSHVAIAVYVPPIDEYRVYQASHGDVNCILLRNFVKRNHIMFSCEVQYEKATWYTKLKYLEHQTGKKYSIWGAVAATVPLFKRLGMGDNDDMSFICSELAYRTYVEGEDHQGCSHDDLNADYVEPREYEKLMRDEGHSIQPQFSVSRGWEL